MNPLKNFLAEYWLFLLIPALLIGAALLWLLTSGGSSSGDPIYNVF